MDLIQVSKKHFSQYKDFKITASAQLCAREAIYE